VDGTVAWHKAFERVEDAVPSLFFVRITSQSRRFIRKAEKIGVSLMSRYFEI